MQLEVFIIYIYNIVLLYLLNVTVYLLTGRTRMYLLGISTWMGDY